MTKPLRIDQSHIIAATTLIKKWDKAMNVQFDNIKQLINNHSAIAQQVAENQEQQQLGFNIFEVVSDTYYKENFHSDILKHLLSQEYHHEGQLFLELFLQCLNQLKNKTIHIKDFQKVEVEREKGRIDIRIRDEKSKKCIIIENKINDAVDTKRQIPNYYDNETAAGYKVVAVVYLTLTDIKKPDKRTWTADDKQRINPLMIILTASKNKKINLINTWLDLCITASNEPDVRAILRQYKAIIKHLRAKEMNYEIMKKFYAEIKTPEAFSAALTIRDLLQNLYEFRARHIEKQFIHEAGRFFEGVSSFKLTGKKTAQDWRAKFENPHSFKLDFWIDIVCLEEEYIVYFHHRDAKDGTKIKTLLEELKVIDRFKQSQVKISYFTTFKFPDEEQIMFDFIEDVLNQLNTRNDFTFSK